MTTLQEAVMNELQTFLLVGAGKVLTVEPHAPSAMNNATQCCRVDIVALIFFC